MTRHRGDEIREFLENEIVTGEIMPGTHLDEATLAQRFAVSRTPIREVLNRLSASGLVELRPRRGAFVAHLSLEKLVEMFETMAEMEAICGRLAARRMTEQERDALVQSHEGCRLAAAAGVPDAYYAANTTFHEVIYDGCHNSFLSGEVRRIRRRLHAYRRLQLRLRNRMHSSYQEHDEIVASILAGDDQGAEKALRDHLMIQGERFHQLVTGFESLKAKAV
ncbi:MAG TPA: GntR family transcriptional regulator [Kiloniellaceae bacterium]|nr:GntR family transcriptional regulator [Kiloniellaceae bacterium]